jgi:hypothetical protein
MKTSIYLFVLCLTNTIVQAQNVGVGQATPIGKLHVTQTNSATIPGLIIDQPGSTATFGSGTTGSIGLLINATGSNTRGLQLIQSGLSGAGQVINMTNANSNEYGLHVNNGGKGFASYFYSTNSSNAVSSLFVQHDGVGNVGSFLSNNVSNPTATIFGQQNGLGNAGNFLSNNILNNTPTIYAQQNGINTAGYFYSQNTANTQPTLYSFQAGLGSAGYFFNQNSLANQPTLYSYQAGLHSAGYFFNQNTANTQPTVYGFQSGIGSAGYFYNQNTSANQPTVYGLQEGVSNAGYFYTRNVANTNATIYGFQEGLGNAAYFYTKNPLSIAHTLYSYQDGKGSAGYFQNNNITNTSNTGHFENIGLGRSIYGYNSNVANNTNVAYFHNGGAGTGTSALFAYTSNTATTGFTASIYNNGATAAGSSSGGLLLYHSFAATKAHNAFLYQTGLGRSLEIFRPNKLAAIQDPALIITDSSNSKTAVFQNYNIANAQPVITIQNNGTTSTSDGTFSGTFSKSGGRGVVGTALLSGAFLSSISETGPTGVQGVAQGNATNQVVRGVSGYAIQNNTISNASSPSNNAPGYFAYMLSDFSTQNSTIVAGRSGGTNYKVLSTSGAGTVSTSRENQRGERVILFGSESPMPTYSDYGKGTLENGSVHITIEPSFANMIFVDPNNDKADLRVIIQLEGDCKGVYVTNKTSTGFDVKELQGGQSNVKFTFQIVANAKDYVDPYNGSTNRLQDVRFPVLDKSMYMPNYNITTQKNENVKPSNAPAIVNENVEENTKKNILNK